MICTGSLERERAVFYYQLFSRVGALLELDQAMADLGNMSINATWDANYRTFRSEMSAPWRNFWNTQRLIFKSHLEPDPKKPAKSEPKVVLLARTPKSGFLGGYSNSLYLIGGEHIVKFVISDYNSGRLIRQSELWAEPPLWDTPVMIEVNPTDPHFESKWLLGEFQKENEAAGIG